MWETHLAAASPAAPPRPGHHTQHPDSHPDHPGSADSQIAWNPHPEQLVRAAGQWTGCPDVAVALPKKAQTTSTAMAPFDGARDSNDLC